jgi:hypothetical protein
MIMQLEEENTSVEQPHSEGRALLQEEKTMLIGEVLTDKAAQMRKRERN